MMLKLEATQAKMARAHRNDDHSVNDNMTKSATTIDSDSGRGGDVTMHDDGDDNNNGGDDGPRNVLTTMALGTVKVTVIW